MAAAIEFHVKPDIDLSGSLVIVGAPTLGLVGSIATRYIVEQLDMDLLGGVHSADFPPFVVVEKGRPVDVMRLHTLETECGLDLTCRRIVTLTSEILPSPRVLVPLAEAIVEWALGIDAQMVIVLDAVLAENGVDNALVRGVSSLPAGADFLRRAKVDPLAEGVIVGLSAALLTVGEHRGQQTVCLLASSQPDHPDARAAARLVELLDGLLPGVVIPSKPLLEQAEAIETKVRTLRKQMAIQEKQAVPPAGPSMFM